MVVGLGGVLVEVGQLRAFLAVAEELHFRRAAERLHMAQPPLTRTIKMLERELGTDLFVRTTRSVALTPAGEALMGPAREVLDSVRRAAQEARAAGRGDVGRVRVAFAGVSTHPLVAAVARRVRAERPGVVLDLSSQNFAQPALRKLAAEETDIALGRWDFVPEGIETEVVVRDQLALAVPQDHHLGAAGQADFAQIGGERFVSLPPHEGSVLTDRLMRLAQQHRFLPEVVQVAPDTQTALALVSAGVGCHLTLQSVADNVSDPHVRFVSVVGEQDLPDVHLRAAWRHDDPNPAVAAVLAILLDAREQG